MYRIYCYLCGVIGGGSGRAVDHSYGSKVGTSLRALWAKYSPMSRSFALCWSQGEVGVS